MVPCPHGQGVCVYTERKRAEGLAQPAGLSRPEEFSRPLLSNLTGVSISAYGCQGTGIFIPIVGVPACRKIKNRGFARSQ